MNKNIENKIEILLDLMIKREQKEIENLEYEQISIQQSDVPQVKNDEKTIIELRDFYLDKAKQEIEEIKESKEFSKYDSIKWGFIDKINKNVLNLKKKEKKFVSLYRDLDYESQGIISQEVTDFINGQNEKFDELKEKMFEELFEVLMRAHAEEAEDKGVRKAVTLPWVKTQLAKNNLNKQFRELRSKYSYDVIRNLINDELRETHQRKLFTDKLRKKIFDRDKGICQICKKQIQFGEPYEIDHINQDSSDNNESNLRTCCRSCNQGERL